jgi:hypothetical protein
MFRWGDAVLIICMIIATVFSFRLFNSSGASTVVIYRDNTIVAEYSLSVEKHFSVQGMLGDVEVCIKNRTVEIQKSSCNHQVCIQTGAISNHYGQIVCAPNHILICIKSKESQHLQPDAIAQ